MTDDHKRILIVEDDADIASALARGLRRAGYNPLAAHDAEGALRIADAGCELAIVDAMLGDDRGEDIIRTLRRRGHQIPILMLSALSSVEDRTRGLEAGADDYVAKPFEMSELITRLQVQESRRATRPASIPLIDPETRSVSGTGRTVTLTEREMDLLEYLLQHENTVRSRGEIFDSLWLNEGGTSENVVDVYIGYLRRKLSPAEAFGLEIKTVRGRGFTLARKGNQ